MLNLIFAATVLIASSASPGEIVWRSPTAGVLAAVSDTVPPARSELSGSTTNGHNF